MNSELLLREHDLKVTPQRLGILSLMKIRGHVDVEELFSEMKKQFSSISLATLYKNVNAMLEKHLITEIKAPNFKAKYEIVKEPHIHLLCKECDEFVDLDLDLESLISDASKKSNYQLKESCVVLSGLCKKCQTK
ncbi:transcriptional repressor [Sulfurimonas sp. SAG-AH-194-C21]|nr:Fur family transcriptional regulator [Sulfurimonas sp. SAG-AH-194-C21]MDF1883705.1 transcriptional repressor [Sulfurimonas sp. SAG-AH-194-C21]